MSDDKISQIDIFQQQFYYRLRHVFSKLTSKSTPLLTVVLSVTAFLGFPSSTSGYQARNYYGARLEPVRTVLHGAGQDGGGFDDYIDEMAPNKHPTIYMAYYTIWDDYADGLRTQLDSYSQLYGDYVSAQIGLSLVDSYQQIAAGNLDDQVENWCRQLGQLGHPVYLRIGYEANGSHNGYNSTDYKAAFIKVTNTIRNLGLEDVATVWCVLPEQTLRPYMDWYPGDTYVDWWSLDLFIDWQINSSYTSNFLDNADAHGKPVMIGESTPASHQTTHGGTSWDDWFVPYSNGIGSVTFPLRTSWNGWFVPYFNLIHNQPGIKAFCYINWNWPVKMPELGGWGDCRLNSNATVAQNFRDEMRSSLYCHATDEITFRQTHLGVTDSNIPPKVTGLHANTNNYYPLLLSWDKTPDDTNIIRYQIKCNGQLASHSHENQYKTYPGQTSVYAVNAVDKGGNQGDYSSTMMIVVPPGRSNIIMNGEFDDSLTKWRPEVFAAGNNMVASIDATGQLSGRNSAKLYITQNTTTFWHMQLRQLFNAYAAKNYKVQFQARSDPATNIKVWIQKYANPYTSYMGQDLSLTTSPQSFTLNCNNFPQNDYVALTFGVGNQPTVPVTIWIDAVVLTEGTTAPSNPQNSLRSKVEATP